MEERILELEAQVAKLTTAVNKLAQLIYEQTNFNKDVLKLLEE